MSSSTPAPRWHSPWPSAGPAGACGPRCPPQWPRSRDARRTAPVEVDDQQLHLTEAPLAQRFERSAPAAANSWRTADLLTHSSRPSAAPPAGSCGASHRSSDRAQPLAQRRIALHRHVGGHRHLRTSPPDLFRRRGRSTRTFCVDRRTPLARLLTAHLLAGLALVWRSGTCAADSSTPPPTPPDPARR